MTTQITTMTTRIMVIDDEPLICRLLEYQLGGAGYHVVSYQRAHDALQELARHQPDLVLLDVMMPEMNGWDVCRQIRIDSNIPIIMLTGKDGDDDIVHGLTSGADDYIGKPFHQGQLVARIEAVLRRSAAGHTAATVASAKRAQLNEPQRSVPAPVAVDHDSLEVTAVSDAMHEVPPERALVVAHVAITGAVTEPAPPQTSIVSLPRLGPLLAEKRRQRELSLYDAAQACGVRWEFLQAIEQEEFGYVPRVELRRALRVYGNLLNIDLAPYAANRVHRPRPTPLTLTIGLTAVITLVIIMLALIL